MYTINESNINHDKKSIYSSLKISNFVVMKTSTSVINQLNKDLQSVHDATVLEAISTVRQKGDHRIVVNLLPLLQHNNVEIKEAAKKVLFDLKDKEAIDEILNQLKSVKDASTRIIILQSFWQSNIHPVNAVSRFVKLAIDGTLEECIEIYSIITNIIDEQIPEDEIMESLLSLNNAMESIREKHKKQLLQDIIVFLNEQEDANH